MACWIKDLAPIPNPWVQSIVTGIFTSPCGKPKHPWQSLCSAEQKLPSFGGQRKESRKKISIRGVRDTSFTRPSLSLSLYQFGNIPRLPVASGRWKPTNLFTKAVLKRRKNTTQCRSIRCAVFKPADQHYSSWAACAQKLCCHFQWNLMLHFLSQWEE